MVARRTSSRMQSNGGTSYQAEVAEMIGDYPAASMVVLFAAGVGIGMIAGHAISESLHRSFTPDESLTHKVACQIRSALKQALPENVWHYLA